MIFRWWPETARRARRALATVLLVLLGLATAPVTRAHEEIVPVIVDTDMALDDARALALLLHAPEVRPWAIVTSDGACPPDIGATNVLRLLRFLNREEIPVGAGRRLNLPAPAWAERSVTLGWSDLPLSTNAGVVDAATVLRQAFARSTNSVTWFCLGPMSNLADLLRRQPEVKKRIGRVWFYGTPPDAPEPGWNTQRDLESARAVFASGLEIVAVQLAKEQSLPFDPALWEAVREIDVPAAKLIARLHAHPNVQRLMAARHFQTWDETPVLLFHEPWLGQLREWAPDSRVRVLENFDPAGARSVYLAELRLGGAPARELVTLHEFPVAPELFQPDLQPLVNEILRRHGFEEWKVNVLTSELHRHLGLYSILGAKMGLRARELLGASLDELRVESLAGLRPPVSCLNDGLQTATGASLGRGTIRVPETDQPQAGAVFTFGEKRLRLRVRAEAVKPIQAAIRTAIQQHGDLSPAYFAEIRRISLAAWRDLDRTRIFEEETIP
jgi:pyrimidine-specific ribonucleoside hydrolase